MSAATEAKPTESRSRPERRDVEDATCLACGCLCDDIRVVIENNHIIEAGSACLIGQSFFASQNQQNEHPIATIDGEVSDIPAALDRAAAILANARRPVIWGLTHTTIEAQAAVVALADRIGAVIGLGNEEESRAKHQAAQRVGVVSATLGEVKNRSDVVVFWGVDPVVTHPRHFERYSVDPRGRFVPEGRAGRTVIVVDSRRTATAELADHFFEISGDSQFETLWTLRALVAGSYVDPARVTSDVRHLGELLQSARYGALFHGSDLGRGRGGQATFEAFLLLVRSLNDRTRFVALPLGGPGNASGAEAVLGWQSGYTLGVDFAQGFPRPATRESSAQARLENDSCDAALIMADDPTRRLSSTGLDGLRRIPSVIISPIATSADHRATVALNSAAPGIHHGGTVLRVDGVMIPLRSLLETTRPSDREYIDEINQRLQAETERS
jgi:formylmethanofuran dehydrogenase subunit B